MAQQSIYAARLIGEEQVWRGESTALHVMVLDSVQFQGREMEASEIN
jgi:hypothetical protein